MVTEEVLESFLLELSRLYEFLDKVQKNLEAFNKTYPGSFLQLSKNASG